MTLIRINLVFGISCPMLLSCFLISLNLDYKGSTGAGKGRATSSLLYVALSYIYEKCCFHDLNLWPLGYMVTNISIVSKLPFSLES